jgi:cyanobactin maturation PatA/PatG family protease
VVVRTSPTILGLTDLWEETLGDPRICIAVLDGPADLSHPSLGKADLSVIETVASGDALSGLAAEHGTHIASIVFGQHYGPVKGIAPNCRGLIAPIFKDVIRESPLPCSQIDLARALLQVLQAGAKIINVSGGQFSPSGMAHPVLADAVRTCAQGGALIVAAAGNQGCDCLHIPGSLPSVLAVGAMDSRGEPLPFSNWGSTYRSQGILAPGENILGALPGRRIQPNSGTSYATPIVAGVAALLMSLQLKRGEVSDAAVVREALLRSALGCEFQRTADCHRLLAGRLNIRGAVSIIYSGGRTMPTEPMQRNSVPPSTPVENLEASDQVLPASKPNCLPNNPEPEPSLTAMSCVPSDRKSTQYRALSDDLITPSACGCGGGALAPPQFVYALGQLGYDLGTEARRDSFIQSMDKPAPNVLGDPYDSNQLLKYLEANPWDIASLIWTLTLDGTAIYAVKPNGPFASNAYQRLLQFLKEQYSEGVERVSIPGVISGKAKLMNGQVVPVIIPEIRGMFNWTTGALVKSVVGDVLPDTASDGEKQARSSREQNIREFLDRVYFDIRNIGVTPQHRAINYAGSNAFNVNKTFESAAKEGLSLDSIEVERSPICRPEADCWDVKLYFFFPQRQVQTVRKAYRFTVDVSDVVPVTVGPVRSWYVR